MSFVSLATLRGIPANRRNPCEEISIRCGRTATTEREVSFRHRRLPSSSSHFHLNVYWFCRSSNARFHCFRGVIYLTVRGRIVRPLDSHSRSISFDVMPGGGLSKCLILLTRITAAMQRNEQRRAECAMNIKCRPRIVRCECRQSMLFSLFAANKIQFAISFLHRCCCIDRLDPNAKAAHRSPLRFILSAPGRECVTS